MNTLDSLTYREKLILYLKDYINIERNENLPIDITQKGIAERVGMSRTHVSRIVKGLKDENIIKEELSNVKGNKRKLKTYHLTKKGVDKSEDILSELSEMNIEVIIDGENLSKPLTDLPEVVEGDLNLLDLISIIEESEKAIDIDKKRSKKKIRWLDEMPEPDEIYQIDETIKELKEWMKSGIPILVLRGRRGYGSTSITSKFVTDIYDRDILWLNVSKRPFDEIKEKLRNFLKEGYGEFYGDIENNIRKKNILLIINDYYEVHDDLVDFLSDLTDDLENDNNLKILVTAREGTPVYERFYQIKDVKDDLVVESKVTPLDKEGIQKLLGVELQEEAVKRIKQFTNGSPLILKLLKEEKRDRLREVSPLSNEQISLLMFLKSKTK